MAVAGHGEIVVCVQEYFIDIEFQLGKNFLIIVSFTRIFRITEQLANSDSDQLVQVHIEEFTYMIAYTYLNL